MPSWNAAEALAQRLEYLLEPLYMTLGLLQVLREPLTQFVCELALAT